MRRDVEKTALINDRVSRQERDSSTVVGGPRTRPAELRSEWVSGARSTAWEELWRRIFGDILTGAVVAPLTTRDSETEPTDDSA